MWTAVIVVRNPHNERAFQMILGEWNQDSPGILGGRSAKLVRNNQLPLAIAPGLRSTRTPMLSTSWSKPFG
jgi:hypothetical protein